MLPAESAVHYRLVLLMGYDGHIYVRLQMMCGEIMLLLLLLEKPMHDKTEESMSVASQTSESQVVTIAELASTKRLLHGIASNMTGLKSGMDAVQTAVETSLRV